MVSRLAHISTLRPSLTISLTFSTVANRAFRFEWCQEHDTVAWPHEAARTSVLPYLSLPASSLKERITRLDERVMTSTFDIK